MEWASIELYISLLLHNIIWHYLAEYSGRQYKSLQSYGETAMQYW